MGTRPSDQGKRAGSQGAQLGWRRGASAGPRAGERASAPSPHPRPPPPAGRRSPAPRSERARCAGPVALALRVRPASVGEGPRQAEPHAHPPPRTRPFSRGWWQVSGCRGTARPRRKQDAAEIRLLTCSCGYAGLIKAELPVVTLLPPSAPQPRALPAAAGALTDSQKPVASGARTTPGPATPRAQRSPG